MTSHNPFSLKGRTVFVTGASSGIGKSIAIECSKMGANMIVSGRNRKRLAETYDQLDGAGHRQIIADMTNKDDIDNITNPLPRLDGVVLCAGIVKTLPVKHIKDDAIEEVFQTNITSSIQIIKRLLKAKKINKGASVIFISSIAATHPKPGNALYSATKGAVNSFGKVLALELAPLKIRVNMIQPGFIKTNLLSSGIISEEQIDEHYKRYPLGPGKPEDVSHACVYLLSDAAKWITGSIFTIDGGSTLK